MSVTHPRLPRITIPETAYDWWFTPDSRSVLTLNHQGQVSRWTGTDFHQKVPLLEIGTHFYSDSFSLDGRFLAVGSTNGVLQIWDLSGRVLAQQLTNTADKVWPLNFLAAGNKLITFSVSDNFLHEWDLSTGSEIQSWQAPVPFSGAIGVSPDERLCVAIGIEGDAVFRNLADKSSTKAGVDVLDGCSASFSPDGKLFAVASNLGFARVWDTASWRQVATLGGFLNGVHELAFSPDGKRLVIGSDGKEAVRLWDTESWQEVTLFGRSGHRFSRCMVLSERQCHWLVKLGNRRPSPLAGTIVGGDRRGGKGNTRFRSLATKQSQPLEFYEPIQILLSTLRATPAMRRAGVGLRDSMPQLPASDSYSADSRPNGRV